METGSIILIIAVAVLLGAIMFKYSAIEAYFFDRGDGEYVSIGNKAMKMSITIGALVGVTALAYKLFYDRSAFDEGLSSVWGIICNAVPYVGFAIIGYCVYNICMTESTVGRIVARSLFVVISCVLGMIGGAIASILAIMIVILLVFLSALLKVNLMGGGSGSSKSKEDNYDATTTDENGFERKLKDVGFGRYQDDKGDYWKDSAPGRVERE